MPENLSIFTEKLKERNTIKDLDAAKQAIPVNINQAVSMFTAIMKRVSECMNKKVKVTKQYPRQTWFDKECQQAKTEVKRTLRNFRRSNSVEDRTRYVELRKQYRKLLTRKSDCYKTEMKNKLINSAKDPKTFWSTLKRISSKKRVTGNIDKDVWLEHFSNVFNATTEPYENVFDGSLHESFSETFNLQLNGDISHNEVVEAISHLKQNKAGGPDTLIPEIFIHSAEIITPFLVGLFNHVFSSGQFPDAWTEAIIQPLHKKGNTQDPNNYRGISLLNVCSKLYSYILNKRLVTWIEENGSIGEEQAGFRRDYSTTDHIFTLFAVIQKYLLHKKKLYVAFIDFKKAFDLISYTKLWPILLKHGLSGKMYYAIQGMYRVVKARVRCGNGAGLTDFFFCQKGLKQGEITSPLLFSLLINELSLDIMNNGKHGVQLHPDIIELFIMLFADDVVLLSYTPVGLQHQLNLLARNADALDLTVNLEKSNIVVFRNGGYLARCEKWYYKDYVVKVVNAYKYLGVWFSTRLSFSHSLESQKAKAKAGIVEIFKTLWKLGDVSPNIFLKLFDSQIKPILLYGSEIWGMQMDLQIEKAHLFALKRLLNVSPKTPNDMVYGETGRTPLHLDAKVSSIRFWLRLLRMEAGRLPRKAYNMLANVHNNGRQCWVSAVHGNLMMYGFGYVWANQGVQNVNWFLRVFRERITDCWRQGWDDRIHERDRYSVYRIFKLEHSLEPYFYCVTNKALRDVFIRFRMGISEIKTHKLRYSTDPSDDLSCPLCKCCVDDEIHFLFVCKATEAFRSNFLPQVYCQDWRKQLTILNDTEHMTNVARYIYHSLKLRTQPQLN